MGSGGGGRGARGGAQGGGLGVGSSAEMALKLLLEAPHMLGSRLEQ